MRRSGQNNSRNVPCGSGAACQGTTGSRQARGRRDASPARIPSRINLDVPRTPRQQPARQQARQRPRAPMNRPGAPETPTQQTLRAMAGRDGANDLLDTSFYYPGTPESPVSPGPDWYALADSAVTPIADTSFHYPRSTASDGSMYNTPGYQTPRTPTQQTLRAMAGRSGSDLLDTSFYCPASPPSPPSPGPDWHNLADTRISPIMDTRFNFPESLQGSPVTPRSPASGGRNRRTPETPTQQTLRSMAATSGRGLLETSFYCPASPQSPPTPGPEWQNLSNINVSPLIGTRFDFPESLPGSPVTPRSGARAGYQTPKTPTQQTLSAMAGRSGSGILDASFYCPASPQSPPSPGPDWHNLTNTRISPIMDTRLDFPGSLPGSPVTPISPASGGRNRRTPETPTQQTLRSMAATSGRGLLETSFYCPASPQCPPTPGPEWQNLSNINVSPLIGTRFDFPESLPGSPVTPRSGARAAPRSRSPVTPTQQTLRSMAAKPGKDLLDTSFYCPASPQSPPSPGPDWQNLTNANVSPIMDTRIDFPGSLPGSPVTPRTPGRNRRTPETPTQQTLRSMAATSGQGLLETSFYCPASPQSPPTPGPEWQNLSNINVSPLIGTRFDFPESLPGSPVTPRSGARAAPRSRSPVTPTQQTLRSMAAKPGKDLLDTSFYCPASPQSPPSPGPEWQNLTNANVSPIMDTRIDFPENLSGSPVTPRSAFGPEHYSLTLASRAAYRNTIADTSFPSYMYADSPDADDAWKNLTNRANITPLTDTSLHYPDTPPPRVTPLTSRWNELVRNANDGLEQTICGCGESPQASPRTPEQISQRSPIGQGQHLNDESLNEALSDSGWSRLVQNADDHQTFMSNESLGNLRECDCD